MFGGPWRTRTSNRLIKSPAFSTRYNTLPQPTHARSNWGIGNRDFNALFLQEAGYSWAREPSSMAVVGLEPGVFSGPSSARRAMFRTVLVSWVGAGQGGWSARGDEPGRDSDQAIWNRSKRCAGARGGVRADMPRCLRILAITVGSTMAAMIVKGPPQWGHCSYRYRIPVYESPSLAFALRAGVRRSKPAPGGFVSNRAQLRRAGAAVGGASAWSAEGVWALTGTPGMIAGRSLALRPRRAKQASPWAWLRARARHGSG